MTENITPEFLAKMHAALRGVKHNVAPKYAHKKKSALANPSIGSSLASSPPPGASGTSGGAAAKSVDAPLADSVAQTTAEAAADMADSKEKSPKAEAPKAASEGSAGVSDDLMHKVLESEIEQVESSILQPLLAQATPPPIENGIFEIKDTHDKIIQRTPYVEGKIQGEVQLFDAQGQKVQTYQCVHGIKQGPMRFFDANGALTHEVPYAKDKREGMGAFYVNGSKVAEITFHEDAMEGPAIYYAGENVSTAALYHNNALQGEMRCFDPQQRLVKTMSYLKGQLNGESVTYYPGGVKVFERMHYLQNVPVDKQIQFYEDGSILSLREYDKGKLIKEKFYDTKGKEVVKEQGEKIANLFPNIPNWKK